MTTLADRPRHQGAASHQASASGGATDPDVLLRELTPALHPNPVVYTVADELPAVCTIFATVREPEGLTIVLEQAEVDWLGLPYDNVAAIITLSVHSSLAAVGLTAAVSQALTTAEISCNVIAGTFHDHLLVPWDRRAEALAALRELQALQQVTDRPTGA